MLFLPAVLVRSVNYHHTSIKVRSRQKPLLVKISWKRRMSLNGSHIFVIEDNLNSLSILMAILNRNEGVVSFDQWTPDTKARLLRNLPIDVILLDLMLAKGLTGYEVFDELRAMPLLAKIPIVAVTASDPGRELARARMKGFDGFISAPFRSTTFCSHISAIIRGEKVFVPPDIDSSAPAQTGR